MFAAQPPGCTRKSSVATRLPGAGSRSSSGTKRSATRIPTQRTGGGAASRSDPPVPHHVPALRESILRVENATGGAMKTSLGIWAFGPMITRFVPGGYQPEHAGETTAERVRRAVEGLGDLIDGYEFHYPQELNEENVDEIREALGDHDIYCLASGLHLDPRFGRGGLSNPDPATRAEATAHRSRRRRSRGQAGRSADRLAGDRGLQLPVPDAVPRELGVAHRRHRRGRGETARSTACSSSSSTRTPSRR